MKNIEELNKRRAPIVIIKDALSEKAKVVRSTKKLEKANKILSEFGLPKELQKDLKKKQKSSSIAVKSQ